MNPIPLVDPCGTVRAFMCGLCSRVPLVFARSDEDCYLDAARFSAERHCLCIACGAEVPGGGMRAVCDSCESTAAGHHSWGVIAESATHGFRSYAEWGEWNAGR